MPDLSTDLTSGDISASGTITATGGFVGSVTGNVAGNVTGNVTGNLTGNVAGNVTGTGTSTLPTAAITTLNLAGALTATITRPASITGHVLNATNWGTTKWTVLTSNAAYNLDGTSGASQQERFVKNGNTTDAFTFLHNGSGTNKFSCPGGANYVLAAGMAVHLIYDPSVSFWLVTPFT